ncbi:hypothetical protein V1290_000498 [Bradyrhizobium sp. AZCC 1578]
MPPCSPLAFWELGLREILLLPQAREHAFEVFAGRA